MERSRDRRIKCFVLVCVLANEIFYVFLLLRRRLCIDFLGRVFRAICDFNGTLILLTALIVSNGATALLRRGFF